MTNPPFNPDELQSLLDIALAGELSDPQRVRLNDHLRGSEQAMRIYSEHAGLHAALAYRSVSKPFAGHADVVARNAGGHVELVTRRSEPVVRNRSRRNALWSILAVAAVFYGAFTLLSWNLRSGGYRDDITRQPDGRVASATQSRQPFAAAATIVGQRKAEFAKGSVHSTGDGIAEGEELELKEGLLEIAFADGAHVILQGPARLVVKSPQQSKLTLGKLVAKVPTAAIGFTIVTPTARIVDLGTEFAAEVTADGASDVHVLTGLVSVRDEMPGGIRSKPLELRAGQSLAVSAKGILSVAAVTSSPEANRFVRTLSDPAELPGVDFTQTDLARSGEGIHLRLGAGSSLQPQGISNASTSDGDGALRVKNQSETFVNLDCSERGPFANRGIVEQGRMGRDGTTLFVSWLTRCEVQHADAYAGVSFMLFGDQGVTKNERLFVGKPFKTGSFGIDLLKGKPLLLDGNPLDQGEQPTAVDDRIHRFIVRIRFRSGDDEVAAFLDPPMREADATPNATFFADVAFDRIRFAVGDNTENRDGACWLFDNLRFGDNWQALVAGSEQP